jgi:hypothetical protein
MQKKSFSLRNLVRETFIFIVQVLMAAWLGIMIGAGIVLLLDLGGML